MTKPRTIPSIRRKIIGIGRSLISVIQHWYVQSKPFPVNRIEEAINDLKTIHAELGHLDRQQKTGQTDGWIKDVKIYEGEPVEFLSEGALQLAKKQAARPDSKIQVRRVKIVSQL